MLSRWPYTLIRLIQIQTIDSEAFAPGSMIDSFKHIIFKAMLRCNKDVTNSKQARIKKEKVELLLSSLDHPKMFSTGKGGLGAVAELTQAWLR